MPSMLRTHTELNPAQWRMLLDLDTKSIAVADVEVWLKRCGATAADLQDLRDRSAVADETSGAVVLTRPGRDLAEHTIRPCWEALWMLSVRGHRGSGIPDVLRFSEDVSIFDKLFAGRHDGRALTEMRDSWGEPVGHRPSWEEASRLGHGANWPGITVHITAAGRRYL